MLKFVLTPSVSLDERGTMRASLRLLAIVTAAPVLALLPQGEALAAYNTTANWSNNSYTGYCGQVDGGYVLVVETYLRTTGAYGGNIDNYWGTNIGNALIQYQSNHGLSADGCAGPATWADMQTRTDPGGTSNDPCVPGTDGYRQKVSGTRAAYYYRRSYDGTWWAGSGGYPVSSPVHQYSYYRFGDGLIADCNGG